MINDVCIVLDQHIEFDFFSASSLKEQSTGRHVAPHGHIILIPSKPVTVLTPSCVLSRVRFNKKIIKTDQTGHQSHRDIEIYLKSVCKQL